MDRGRKVRTKEACRETERGSEARRSDVLEVVSTTW